jgi:hypothetical protein
LITRAPKAPKGPPDTLWDKVTTFLKGQDVFGAPVSLTFAGNETVKTFTGGCCSCIAQTFFTLYIFLIMVGFIWAPEVVLKFFEGF